MEANSPEAIVLLTRDVGEFGSRGFGVDYGRHLLSWIQARYVPVRRLDSDRFSILILAQGQTEARSQQ